MQYSSGNPVFFRDSNALVGDNGIPELLETNPDPELKSGFPILYDAEVEDYFFDTANPETGAAVGWIGEAADQSWAYDVMAFWYERDLAERPLDLVLLGMGADGHTASLFPGTDALHAEGRGAVACFVPQRDQSRVSLTLAEINRAHAVLFLVAGRDKAAAIAAIRGGHSSAPAALVQPRTGRLWWMMDTATAEAVRGLFFALIHRQVSMDYRYQAGDP